jgi:TPR repeat protein
LDDWRRILHHAKRRNNPFANAVAAYCYSSPDIFLVTRNLSAAKVCAKAALPYLQQQQQQNYGCRLAMFYLGYFHDFYLIEDSCSIKDAVANYSVSAHLGYARAYYYLGNCYLRGNGVERNGAEAVRLFLLAAQQGLASAQFGVGVCYCEGAGVKCDLIEAAYWYERAAAQNHAPAIYDLGMCYKHGEGVQKDTQTAA